MLCPRCRLDVGAEAGRGAPSGLTTKSHRTEQFPQEKPGNSDRPSEEKIHVMLHKYRQEHGTSFSLGPLWALPGARLTLSYSSPFYPTKSSWLLRSWRVRGGMSCHLGLLQRFVTELATKSHVSLMMWCLDGCGHSGEEDIWETNTNYTDSTVLMARGNHPNKWLS